MCFRRIMKAIARNLFVALSVSVGLVLFVNAPGMAQIDPGEQKDGQTKTTGDIGSPGIKAGKGVNTSTGTTKKDYRIEVEKDNEDHEVLVKFISPEGKTIKTISPDKAITAKSGKSLIHQSGYSESPDFSYAEYDRELMNAKGEVKWHKSWKNYPEYGVDPEAGWSGWFEGIADNGERSYITYRSTEGAYNLVVLGENGEELARTSYPEIISGIEISPDGTIVGANVQVLSAGRRWKHLLFLEVSTGKTKLLRAEDKNWGGGFILSSGEPLIPGKIIIEFWERNNPKIYPWIYVEFDNLPDEIVKLVQIYGEKQ